MFRFVDCPITKNSLDHHMQIHRDERSYKCDECNKTFKLQESLIVHKEGPPFSKDFFRNRDSCDYCKLIYNYNCPAKKCQHLFECPSIMTVEALNNAIKNVKEDHTD